MELKPPSQTQASHQGACTYLRRGPLRSHSLRLRLSAGWLPKWEALVPSPVRLGYLLFPLSKGSLSLPLRIRRYKLE